MSPTKSRQVIAANQLIDRLMKTVLHLSAGAARVRLALIRRETARLRYDVTNSVALRGRWIGSPRSDQPLSDWSDFLPALLAGQCALHRILDVRMAAPAFGFPSSRPSIVLVCPVGGPGGHLVGAIFIMWDGDAQPPEHVALRGLMAEGKRVATQIAAVLELCGGFLRREMEPRWGRCAWALNSHSATPASCVTRRSGATRPSAGRS
jgi:hypothetical protein